MNWKTILFVGVIGAGAYYALNYFAGGIRYSFKGIKMRGFEGLKLKVSLLYNIQNVNDISATVSSLVGKVFYGTYELNTLNITKPVTIGPGATEEMDVQFTISPGSLLSEIIQFFEKKDGLKKFIMKGTMRGKIGEVPFIYPINEILQLAE
jgi:hypothetical protein